MPVNGLAIGGRRLHYDRQMTSEFCCSASKYFVCPQAGWMTTAKKKTEDEKLTNFFSLFLGHMMSANEVAAEEQLHAHDVIWEIESYDLLFCYLNSQSILESEAQTRLRDRHELSWQVCCGEGQHVGSVTSIHRQSVRNYTQTTTTTKQQEMREVTMITVKLEKLMS